MTENDFVIEYCGASERQATTEQLNELRQQAEQARQAGKQDFANLLERVTDALENGESIGTAIAMLLTYEPRLI